jgi:hypothetical protein
MSKPIPSTGKTDKEYFRDYPLTGHAADMPKSTRMSSRPEESHPRALPKPCVNLSIHTAPDVRPFP